MWFQSRKTKRWSWKSLKGRSRTGIVILYFWQLFFPGVFAVPEKPLLETQVDQIKEELSSQERQSQSQFSEESKLDATIYTSDNDHLTQAYDTFAVDKGLTDDEIDSDEDENAEKIEKKESSTGVCP